MRMGIRTDRPGGVATGGCQGGGGRVFRWMRSAWSQRAGRRAGALGAALARDGLPGGDGLVELVPDGVAPAGPYDLRLAPSDGVRRLDLGSLLVPLLDGVEYQLRLDAGRVVAVVALAGRSAMELAAFAAPKTRGVWDDVLAEVRRAAAPLGPAARVSAGPGVADAATPTSAPGAVTSVWTGGPADTITRPGRFGPQLWLEATTPPGQHPAESAAPAPDGAVRSAPAGLGALPDFPVLAVAAGPAALSGRAGPVRLVGIDGPRWFLRAAVTGPAADPSGESLMDDVLRATIVIRGGRAMPVRAPLSLRLPTDTEDPPGPDDLVDPMAGADPDGPPVAGGRAGQPSIRTIAARGSAGPTDLESLRARPTGTGSTDARRLSYGVVPPPGGLPRNLMTWG